MGNKIYPNIHFDAASRIDKMKKHSNTQRLQRNKDPQFGDVLHIGQLTLVRDVPFFEATLHRVRLDRIGEMAEVQGHPDDDGRIAAVPLQREHQAFLFGLLDARRIEPQSPVGVLVSPDDRAGDELADLPLGRLLR